MALGDKDTSVRCHTYLSFSVPTDDPRLLWLMREFRLMVNKSIRIAEAEGIRSRARLSGVAYPILSKEHDLLRQYIPSAFGVALSAIKARRRRVRDGAQMTSPYSKRLMARVVNQGYRLDRETGLLRLPVRAHVYVEISLPLSRWHRQFLMDPKWNLGSLTIVPGKVIITLRTEAPAPYDPREALALDTNEDSLDGVVTAPSGANLVTASFDGVSQVQATYFRRRRRLARKKAHDRRVVRRLLHREGDRERRRVLQRLHRVSKVVVACAQQRRAAIILEDLSMPSPSGLSKKMNRRLSSWPRSEIHRQIEYKAALAGVPVIKVNPAWTSKTCPVCGARRRDRVGQDFVCVVCDWEMDRQHNAGLNILKSALASNEALARAVRFRPGALRRDVVSPLYALPAPRAGAREEPSGVEPPATRESAPSAGRSHGIRQNQSYH